MGIVGDLRAVPALGTQFLNDLHDPLGYVIIGIGVGCIEHQKIHARIGQQLQMPPDNPAIPTIVVTVQRLAPPVEIVGGTDTRNVLVKGDLVPILRADLADVVDLLRTVLTEPDEVKHTDLLVFARGAYRIHQMPLLVKADQHIGVVSVSVNVHLDSCILRCGFGFGLGFGCGDAFRCGSGRRSATGICIACLRSGGIPAAGAGTADSRNGKQQQCRQRGAQQSGSLSFLRVLHYHSTAFLTRRRKAGTPPSDSLCTRV